MAKVFILGGPTAAGKTDLALRLAEQAGAVIVSADAMTVYRGLDIGTAKPPRHVLQSIPHGCVNVRNLDQEFSVADFQDSFTETCRAHPRVLVVGGTPFYLSALVRPLAELPAADAEVRASLGALEDLHGKLAATDPESAARIHPNDRVRLVRALEVYQLTGKTLTEHHRAGATREPVAATLAWMDRPNLRDRVSERLAQMMDEGYLDEARGILEAGWSPELRPLQAFAYRHLIQHLQGSIGLDEALQRTEIGTWRFARKQRTWARGQGWENVDVSTALELGLTALR